MKPESSLSSWTGPAPAASSQRGNCDRLPVASTTRSASSRSPESVRTPVTCGGLPLPVAREEAGDRHPPADVEPGLGVRRLGQDLLEHGATSVDGAEPLIAVARRPVGDRRGHDQQRIERDRPVRLERRQDIGERLLEHVAAPRQQQVGLMELGHAVARPPLPGVFGRARAPARGRARAPSPRGRLGGAASRPPARTRPPPARRSSASSAHPSLGRKSISSRFTSSGASSCIQWPGPSSRS